MMGNGFGSRNGLWEVVRSIVGSGTSNLTADGVQLAYSPSVGAKFAPLEINRNLFLI